MHCGGRRYRGSRSPVFASWSGCLENVPNMRLFIFSTYGAFHHPAGDFGGAACWSGGALVLAAQL
jgi:hypothetical protein